ncbi:2169_t:CDS:1 [Ambispora gerdemannii]|uniref:2169_t:CDS:1 n=1 Tax=Ambispora gerdemannii TaxID=144530 RepID=A0A9N8ZF31_9GLOM|nr:2169_t:CDS:1 [Ambispora gerdemannii]
MDAFLSFFLLSITMLVGSFLVGIMPLFFSPSDKWLKSISLFGIGLLVGTSLIVIIPEGIETLYSVPRNNIEIFPNYNTNPIEDTPVERRNILPEFDLTGYKIYDISNTNRNNRRQESLSEFEKPSNNEVDSIAPPSQIDGDNDKENLAHRYIGIALISGYILMFLIDQIDTFHEQSPSRLDTVEYTEMNAFAEDNIGIEDDRDKDIHINNMTGNFPAKIKSHSMTIGLVIHAAADGIALGASANQPTIEFIVFLAIMLHKAPSAFGLCTILLREGYSRQRIRKHVAIFSMSAPLTAIITFMLLQSRAQLNPNSMQWWTAILLLFSGGTFLYVAMHVMQDVNNGPGKLSGQHIVTLILGMSFPLLLEFEHTH